MHSVGMVVAHIQALSANPNELSHLHSLLQQWEDSLRAQAPLLRSHLAQLDPARHFLGYLYLLEACSSGQFSNEHASGFLQSVVGFINICSAEQIRLAPDKFISLCKKFREQVMQLQVPMQGILALHTAIRKLQPSLQHLTPLHSDFLLLCILAKRYKASLSILDDDIFEFDQPKDLFLYCYYGGMVNIGLKRYWKALKLLHNVVTTPMTSLNAIIVEASKKYILVSLVHNGQVPLFPKYISSTAQRNLKNNVQPYIDLATSYATGIIYELEACIRTNTEKFQSDNNLGLVKQVQSSLYKRNVQRLTQSNLTLSLHDIANTMQFKAPKEAEMHVLRMVQDGEIFATINQEDGMVNFHEDPEQYKSCEMINDIDASIERANQAKVFSMATGGSYDQQQKEDRWSTIPRKISYDQQQKEDRWSTIPRKILEQVLNKLDNVLPDLFQCGAVCKWWQSVLLENHPALAAGVPLLMVAAWSNVFEHAVLDISTKKLYRLPSLLNNRSLLNMRINTGIIGSSFGWLVTMEDSTVQLLNPITRACISLPPTNMLIRVVLSSDPRRSGCMVMAFSRSNRRLSFCRIGDQKWTMLGPKIGELCSYDDLVYYKGLYDDLVYHKGLFYAITQSGAVVSWDLTHEPKMTVVARLAPLPKSNKVQHRCLSSADNDLLMLTWDYYFKIDIHKLDVTSKKWEEMTSLDGRIVFVEGEYRMFLSARENGSIFMSISANVLYGCTTNCIYFHDMHVYRPEGDIILLSGEERYLSYPRNWITLPQL